MGNKEVQFSDMFEYANTQLILGSFNEYQKEAVLTLLKEIEWLRPTIEEIHAEERLSRYRTFLQDMENGEYEPHPFSWSAIYHYFSQTGIDTSEMRQVINTSKILSNDNSIKIIYNLLWKI